EPESGLHAAYAYDPVTGDLVYARNAWGGVSKYVYDNGWPTEREDYVPEGILQQSCELACAPSESSCDAGGACDSAVDAGRAYCTRQCLQCGVDCSIDCYNYSEGLIADPDGPPDPV